MLTNFGDDPVEKSTFAAKLTPPVVDVFRNTDTVLLPKFATARSDLPSPSRSPIQTE
jgi:hypothetical protein